MAINNVDIYGDEWIELVFKNRNKSYGAYELRKHYTVTVFKALAFTFGATTAVIYIAFLIFKPAPLAAHPVAHPVTTVLNPVIVSNLSPIVPTHHSHHRTANGYSYSALPNGAAKPAKHTYVPKVDLKGINTENTPVNTSITPPAENKTVYTPGQVDVKPLPVGGAQGWASYLQKNLVYPEDARKQGISGKVYLSFTVEADGSITDITVDKPAGHGFDEEALRVLKQSPQWQPGVKDGEAIRVHYTLPINFQMVK